MEGFYTINKSTSAEITEKKSKFIANLFYVENKMQAEELIKEIKKKYHDARHNCYAYRVLDNEKILEKQSDDGEPSGTAGNPMLEILKGKNLCNVLVIVTRYFGGILLGTGGLARAYTEAANKAIEFAEQIYKCEGYLLEANMEYKTIENFKYYCKKNDINIIDIQYSDVVSCKIELDSNKKEKLMIEIDNKNIIINNIQVLCKKFINKSVEK
ncbi:MAG: YigZ family protein [Clostridia bacterium]|nr:YigZ family protein [Clostridia bacterium]